MAVGCELNATRYAFGQIVNKRMSRCRVSLCDEPAGDELGVCTDRRLRPDVAIAKLTPLALRHILLFGVTKAPNLIALNPLTGEITKRFVLVLLTGAAYVSQQFEDSWF